MILSVCLLTQNVVYGVRLERIEESVFWQFLFGETMDHKVLQAAGIRTLDHVRVSLEPGWDIGFSGGIPFADPAYITLVKKEDSRNRIHGVAYKIVRDYSEALRRYEAQIMTLGVQNIEKVKASVYDEDGGNFLEVYIRYPNSTSIIRPSKRHVNRLVEAAENMELEETYVEKLRAIQLYSPSDALIQRRATTVNGAIRLVNELKKIIRRDATAAFPVTLDDGYRIISESYLSLSDGTDNRPTYVSIAGMVFETTPLFFEWRGREISNMLVKYFRGSIFVRTLEEVKRGSSYALLGELGNDEVDYIGQHIDSLLGLRTTTFIGILKDYWEEQLYETEQLRRLSGLAFLKEMYDVHATQDIM